MVDLRTCANRIGVAQQRSLKADLDGQLARHVEVCEILRQAKARKAGPALPKRDVYGSEERALPGPVRSHDGRQRLERQIDSAMRSKVTERNGTEHLCAT
jgi:hypothetical protein